MRGYTITHPVPESGLFFAHNCGKFTPLRLQRWVYQNYENYSGICYPPCPGLHQSRGIFLLSLMTNYGKFLTLQTATHKTHKTHNCHVLIDTPLPYRGIFSPVLIVFCRWLRQIGKERICGALSRIIFLITQTLMASPCNPGGFFNLSLCFVIHSEYRQYG